MERKYAKIFKVNEHSQSVRIDEDIEEIVKTPTRTQRAPDTPKITATITITKANIRTVQNFLWKLTEKGMKDEFEFNEVATSTESKSNIQVNEFDAHLIIVKQSLNLLLADPDEKTKLLAPYLLRYLPKHLLFLSMAQEFHDIGSEDKIRIWNGISALLVDGDVFEKHWDSCQPCLSDWFWNESNSTEGIEVFCIEVFWKWLNDPEAIRGLSKRDKIWLRELHSTPNPNRNLLRQVTVVVAKNWLQSRLWDAKKTFMWIRDFLSLLCLHLSLYLSRFGQS